MIIYTDGIFDLFHRGHLEFLNNIKKKFNNSTLIVGIINDNDATNYKRKPIYNENDRYVIIENLKCVNKIIKDAPLIMNEDFINENNIDLVVHGFSDENDINKYLLKFIDLISKYDKKQWDNVFLGKKEILNLLVCLEILLHSNRLIIYQQKKLEIFLKKIKFL